MADQILYSDFETVKAAVDRMYKEVYGVDKSWTTTVTSVAKNKVITAASILELETTIADSESDAFANSGNAANLTTNYITYYASNNGTYYSNYNSGYDSYNSGQHSGWCGNRKSSYVGAAY